MSLKFTPFARHIPDFRRWRLVAARSGQYLYARRVVRKAGRAEWNRGSGITPISRAGGVRADRRADPSDNNYLSQPRTILVNASPFLFRIFSLARAIIDSVQLTRLA